MVVRGMNDEASSKVFAQCLEGAIDDFGNGLQMVTGVTLSEGMSAAARMVYLAPEVYQLLSVYRNTSLMIVHMIHATWEFTQTWDHIQSHPMDIRTHSQPVAKTPSTF